MMMRQVDEDETMMQQWDYNAMMMSQWHDNKKMTKWWVAKLPGITTVQTNKCKSDNGWSQQPPNDSTLLLLGGRSWTSKDAKDAVGPNQLGQEQHGHHGPLCWIPLLLEWSGIPCIVLRIILKDGNMIHVELFPTNTQRLPLLPVCLESIQLCNHCFKWALLWPQRPTWVCCHCCMLVLQTRNLWHAHQMWQKNVREIWVKHSLPRSQGQAIWRGIQWNWPPGFHLSPTKWR